VNRYVSLIGVLALLACVSTPRPPEHVADASQFFLINPVRPVAELLPLALAATPPVEPGEFRPADLVELTTLDSTIKLDIRYATTHNFLSTPLYSQARAFMQRPAAQAVVRVQHALAGEGYGLLVHDAYRPWYVTKIFWDATPADKHEFVADPTVGSRHNRGCAVDLTLYDLQTGRAVAMPSLYDEMSARAYPSYAGGTAEQRHLRDLLRRYMEAEGFTVYEYEWWHFDYRDWKSYAIQNVRFEAIGANK
jgi:zinc D-Ala-D-Ala dipeptidase